MEVVTWCGRKWKVPFKDHLPKHTAEERAQLEESIRTIGIQDSVKVLPDDTVIDGHTRLEIADKVGIKLKDVPVEVMELTLDAAEEAAVALNFVRRSFDADKRNWQAKKLAALSWSATRIAKVMGVHPTTVSRMLKAFDDGFLPPIVDTKGRTQPRTKTKSKPAEEKAVDASLASGGDPSTLLDMEIPIDIPEEPIEIPVEVVEAVTATVTAAEKKAVPKGETREQLITKAKVSLGVLVRTFDALAVTVRAREHLDALTGILNRVRP